MPDNVLGGLNRARRFDGVDGWAWAGGPTGTNRWGSYAAGAPQNPGARRWAAVWTRGGGRSWIFGNASHGP